MDTCIFIVLLFPYKSKRMYRYKIYTPAYYIVQSWFHRFFGEGGQSKNKMQWIINLFFGVLVDDTVCVDISLVARIFLLSADL